MIAELCAYEHPHPDHPCGRPIIDGVTACSFCGHLDGSLECRCWTPIELVTDEELAAAGLTIERGAKS